MAKDASFDIVSEVDMQEVDNALNQADKEIGQRFDFKGSNTKIERKDQEIHIDTTDDMKLRNVLDVFEGKLVKRNVDIKSFDYGKVEPSLGGRVKQIVKVRSGIDKEQAKKITTAIKDSKLKVQASIQGDAVRVTGKSRDDLQEVIRMLRDKNFDFALQFTNYR